MGRGTSKAGVGGSRMYQKEQHEAYNKYMSRMTAPFRVKYERSKSLARGDNIFRDDDDLKSQIANKLQTDKMDSHDIQASIDEIRFISVPDSKGYGDVEVSFKPVVTHVNTGKSRLGGGVLLEKRTKNLPRQTLKIKVMNIY